MKINGLRWGYDGGGFACGPMDGSCIAELIGKNDAGSVIYVTISVMQNFEAITVSETSKFDVWMNNVYDLDDQLNDSIERYDLEIYEGFTGEEFEGSEYVSAIRFARFCLDHYMSLEGDPDQGTADAFIQPYLGKDTDSIDAPLVTYGIIDDEDDEEADY